MGGSHYRNETSALRIAEVYRNFTALVLALITSHKRGDMHIMAVRRGLYDSRFVVQQLLVCRAVATRFEVVRFDNTRPRGAN